MDWFQSFISWTKEKINSPLYITFFVAVVLWNWKSFYVLFWLDSTNFLGINQLQYALVVARKIGHTHIYQLDWTLNHLWFFGVPVLVTFLVVWHLPRIHNLAHKRYLEFRFQRELEFVRQDTKYQQDRQMEIKKQLEVVKSIQEDTSKIEEIEKDLSKASPQQMSWIMEYEKNEKLKQSLEDLSTLYYYYGGKTNSFDSNYNRDNLSLWDLNGLVNYKGGDDMIDLTEKGRFFLSLHKNNDPLPPQN